MTKRAPGQFERKARDLYPTPGRAVPPLIPHLDDFRFAEPCCGAGDLIRHLAKFGLKCVYSGDIATGQNALDWNAGPGIRQIITNPPWAYDLLRPLLDHFIASGLPVWLLLDADFCHTVRARAFIERCSHVVAIGRLKWEPDSEFTGLDNNAWYRFERQHQGGPIFVPRMEKAA